MNELISIILPCYKAEKFLDNIIKDVLAQSYKVWELLIVSNGEGQAPQLAIARAYAAKYPNISVLTSVKGGVSRARNLGMEKAQGKWIVFIDADDRITPSHLQIFADAVTTASEPPDIVLGGFDKQPIPKLYHTKRDLVQNDAYNVISPPWNKLYRSDFVKEFRFNTDYTMFEDALFADQLFTRTNKISVIPMTGYTYVQVAGSAVSRYHKFLEAAWNDCSRYRRIYQREAGLSDEEIDAREVAGRFMRAYNLVRNIYKDGAPLNMRQRHAEIVRIVYKDPIVAKSEETQSWAELSTFVKLWRLCYRSHMPWLMTSLMELKRKLK